MGLDVNIYAVGAVDGDTLRRANDYMRARFGESDYGGGVWLDRDTYYQDRVSVNTLARYYGPGYERGEWPTIYAMIRAVQAALPGTAVHYGGDSEDECPEATPDELASIWDHWLGDHWNDYRGTRGIVTLVITEPTP